MKRIANLGAVEGTASATKTQSLGNMPTQNGKDLYRACELMMKISWDVDTAADAEPTLVELLKLVTGIRIENFLSRMIDLSGDELRAFGWYMARQYDGTEDVAVAASQSGAVREAVCIIPLEMPEHDAGDDFDVPASLFSMANLAIDFAAFSFVPAAGAGVCTVNSITVSCWVSLDPRRHAAAVALPEIGAVTIPIFGNLPAGIYSDLFIMRPDAGWTTANDLQNILLETNAETILRNVKPDAVYMLWNYDRGLATPGLASVYETVTTPSWVRAYAAFEIFPLIWQGTGSGQKARRLIDTMGGLLKLDIQGDVDDVKVVYRRFRPLTESEKRRQYEHLGITDFSSVVGQRQGADGMPISPEQLRQIPGALTIPYKVTGLRKLGAVDASLQATYRDKVIARGNVVQADRGSSQTPSVFDAQSSAAYLPGLL